MVLTRPSPVLSTGTRRIGSPHPERQDTGAVAIVVTILVVVLFGLLAIVVDLGYARSVRLEAQLAADSAALAAAQALADSPELTPEQAWTLALARAEPFVVSNLGIDPSVWSHCTDCLSVDLTAQRVTVTLPSQARSSFSGIYGHQTIEVSGEATATWGSGLPGDCLLCTLKNTTVDQNTTVSGGNAVIGGTLSHSGESTFAVTAGNVLYALLDGVVPLVDRGFLAAPLTTTFTDPFAETAVHDPWSALPPSSSIPPTTVVRGGTCSPPYGSVSFITTEYVAKCQTFADGLYLVIPTAGYSRPIHLGSYYLVTGDVTGQNVAFLATCRNDATGGPQNCATASSSDGASFDVISRNVELSGIVDTTGELAPFRGFTMLADPANTNTAQILSTELFASVTHIEGNVYLPAQDLTIAGQVKIDGQVIVGKNLMLGSSCPLTTITVNAPTRVLAPRPVGEVRLITDR